jgi:hypothetical protein
VRKRKLFIRKLDLIVKMEEVAMKRRKKIFEFIDVFYSIVFINMTVMIL